MSHKANERNPSRKSFQSSAVIPRSKGETMNRTQTPHEARGKRSARGTSHRIQGRTRRDSGCRLYHRARLSADPTGTGRGRNLLCSFPLGGKRPPAHNSRSVSGRSGGALLPPRSSPRRSGAEGRGGRSDPAAPERGSAARRPQGGKRRTEPIAGDAGRLIRL